MTERLPLLKSSSGTSRSSSHDEDEEQENHEDPEDKRQGEVNSPISKDEGDSDSHPPIPSSRDVVVEPAARIHSQSILQMAPTADCSTLPHVSMQCDTDVVKPNPLPLAPSPSSLVVVDRLLYSDLGDSSTQETHDLVGQKPNSASKLIPVKLPEEAVVHDPTAATTSNVTENNAEQKGSHVFYHPKCSNGCVLKFHLPHHQMIPSA